MPDTNPNAAPQAPEFSDRVVTVVRSIPVGRVATYGEVAAVSGSPRAARGVGSVLSGKIEEGIPWWRVVNRSGALTIPSHLGLRTLQRTLLESEDVHFDADGRVDMTRHRWVAEATEID
jgi:methylated-DNA-protein-cysteine methyltransferase-like protein